MATSGGGRPAAPNHPGATAGLRSPETPQPLPPCQRHSASPRPQCRPARPSPPCQEFGPSARSCSLWQTPLQRAFASAFGLKAKMSKPPSQEFTRQGCRRRQRDLRNLFSSASLKPCFAAFLEPWHRVRTAKMLSSSATCPRSSCPEHLFQFSHRRLKSSSLL